LDESGSHSRPHKPVQKIAGEIWIADYSKTSVVEAIEITADFNFGEPQLKIFVSP
jgi:hypothetical protein